MCKKVRFASLGFEEISGKPERRRRVRIQDHVGEMSKIVKINRNDLLTRPAIRRGDVSLEVEVTVVPVPIIRLLLRPGESPAQLSSEVIANY